MMMKYPTLRDNPRSLEEKVSSGADGSTLISMIIERILSSKKLITVHCRTGDAYLTRELVHELSGGCFCIGYLQDLRKGETGQERKLDLILTYGNKVPMEDGFMDDVKNAVYEAKLHLFLCADLKPVQEFGPDECHQIFLRPLCLFASYKRVIYALSRADEIPRLLQRIFYGDTRPFNPTYFNCATRSIGELQLTIHGGCQEYLNEARNTVSL